MNDIDLEELSCVSLSTHNVENIKDLFKNTLLDTKKEFNDLINVGKTITQKENEQILLASEIRELLEKSMIKLENFKKTEITLDVYKNIYLNNCDLFNQKWSIIYHKIEELNRDLITNNHDPILIQNNMFQTNIEKEHYVTKTNDKSNKRQKIAQSTTTSNIDILEKIKKIIEIVK